jgi:Smg protein
MDERLTELLARLRERFAPDSEPDQVEEYLSSIGYDRREIGEILTAFFADLSPRRHDAPTLVSTPMTFRVQGPHERGRFAPEAWGHLLSLSGAGLLSAMELEHVIERAMAQIDGRIAIDDLRSLMESAGMDESGQSGDHTTVH